MTRKIKETTIEGRKVILNLHDMDKSYGVIAKGNRFTVRCCPLELTIREKRKITNIVKKNPKLNSFEIASMIKDEC